MRPTLDEEQEKKLQREFARQYHLITRDDRLDQIAEDLVRHFAARGYRGKAHVRRHRQGDGGADVRQGAQGMGGCSWPLGAAARDSAAPRRARAAGRAARVDARRRTWRWSSARRRTRSTI